MSQGIGQPFAPGIGQFASSGGGPVDAVPTGQGSVASVWNTPIFSSGIPFPELATAETEDAEEPTAKVPAVAPKPAQFVAPESSRIWGIPLSRVTMDQALDGISKIILDRIPRYIITANLNYAMLVESHARLAETTQQAAMVLADGQPMVWRSRWFGSEPLPERVTGSELIFRLAQRAAQKGWRIYFLGAEPGVAQTCADRLQSLYPGLQIAGFQSPPYRALSAAELQQQHDHIRAAKPDILLVAFGQPKGELWIEEHYQALGVPLSIQLGASFDFVAGRVKRAPVAWQKLGLEWAYRMFSDPQRLVPRYAANASFLFRALLKDWKEAVDQKYGQPVDESLSSPASHST